MFGTTRLRIVKDNPLSAGDPEGDLHDQCHRVGEHELAQDHQESRLVSEPRRATQTLLSGTQKYQSEMDGADSGLESRADSLYYPVSRPDDAALIPNPFTQNSGHPPP